MLFNVQDITKNFDIRDYTQGKAYQSEGRVQDLKKENDGAKCLSALVQGTASAPYRVEIEVLQEGAVKKLESYCTCPTGFMCKHGAAALYESIAQATRTHEQIKSPVLKVQAKKQKSALSWEMTEWLKKVESKLSSTDDEIVDRIIYLVEADKESLSGLSVTPAIQHRLRAGGWSRFRPLNANQIASLAEHKRILTSKDMDALALLSPDKVTTHGVSAGWDLPSDAEMIDLFLSRIIKTGRAFIECGEEVPTMPLQLGPSLYGELTWVATEDGKQKPILIPQEAGMHILPSVSPWYLNPSSHKTGPIHCYLDRTVVGSFLKAPAVDQKEAKLLRKHIERKKMDIPTPYDVKKGRGKLVTPMPRITIKERRNDDITVAYLSFVYENELVAPENPSLHYATKEEDTITLHKRHKTAEKQILKELNAQGLALAPDTDLNDPLSAMQRLMPATSTSPWFWLDFHYLIVDRLLEAGFEVIDQTIDLPTSAKGQGGACVIVEPDTDDIEAEFTQTGAWWFSLDLGISVDGKRVQLLPLLVDMLKEIKTAEDIDKLTESGKVFVLLEDGRRLALPADRVRMILKTLVELYDEKALDEDGKLRVSMDLAAAFLNLEAITRKRWVGESKLRKLVEKLSSFEGIHRNALPKGLDADLRPYQVDGFNWLHFLGSYGLSGILADDMGLGKTIQALTYIQSQHEKGDLKGPCLVVMPTSLVANWQAESAKFTPDLKVLTLHGKDRLAFHKDIKNSNLVLTTYPLLPRDSEELNKIEWDIVLLDEAQAIKNPSAKMTQAACSLNAKQRLCLTGTPVENHLGEAWSLFTFLMPGLLGDSKSFTRHYRNPIEKDEDADRKQLFARRLRPFILRRLKTEVAKELPPKTEIIRRVTLSDQQQDLYETVRNIMDERVRDEITAKGLGRSHLVVLDALLKLRQTCCDPRLVKLEQAQKITESAKLEELMEMLPTLIEEGRRILLFSQFTSMLDLIKPELDKLKIPFVELRGSTKDRQTPIERFQNEEVPLFLISLKAGGTGLNLTAADTVIHYDPWWNPSVENQATDRAHRIGQDKPVFVYKMIVKDTVEERILELQEKKAGLANTLFGDKPGAAAKLTQDDINWLISGDKEMKKEVKKDAKAKKKA